MQTRGTELDGLRLLIPDVHRDSRGVFVETYNRRVYESLGVGVTFVQDNHSRSLERTVRGLHFQMPPGQAKLVRVARGRAMDVVVDIRPQSATFGDWEAFELDDQDHHQLFIPAGFAHGFCALGSTVDFVYKVSSYYDPSAESGIAWDDPDLAIPWPVTDPIVSGRDSLLPRLRDLHKGLLNW